MIVELDSACAIYVRLDWLKHKHPKSLQGLLNKSNLNIKVKDDACVYLYLLQSGDHSQDATDPTSVTVLIRIETRLCALSQLLTLFNS